MAITASDGRVTLRRTVAVDWTVVLTATATGAAGYAGARLQARVSLAQARAQLTQAVADRNLSAEEKREAAYHDFLDAVRELHLLVYGDPGPSPAMFQDWNAKYQHLLNGVGLVGVAPVRDAARHFDEILQTLTDHVPPSGSFVHGLRTGYAAIESDVTQRFRDLLDCMSADVSPSVAAESKK